MKDEGRVFFVVVLAFFLLAAEEAGALTFAEWMAGYPTLSGVDAGMMADPDQDGECNLIEFAFAGRNPTVADMQVSRTVPVIGRRAENGLPAKVIGAITPLPPNTAIPAKWHMGLRFYPREGVTGIRFLPEVSIGELDGMRSWFSGRNAVVVRDGEVAGEKIAWGLQLLDAGRAKRAFMRVRVKTVD